MPSLALKSFFGFLGRRMGATPGTSVGSVSCILLMLLSLPRALIASKSIAASSVSSSLLVIPDLDAAVDSCSPSLGVHFAGLCYPSHQSRSFRSLRHAPSSQVVLWDPRSQARLRYLSSSAALCLSSQEVVVLAMARSSASLHPLRYSPYCVDRF